MANGRLLIGLSVIVLLVAHRAQAQVGSGSSATAASSCVSHSGQPPCLAVTPGTPVGLERDVRNSAATETRTPFGNVTGLALWQADTARTTATVGPTWRLKAGVFYRLPGSVQFSASVVARRGYGLPLYMVQPLGSDVQMPEGGDASIESGSAPIRWETELRLRKTLMSSDALDLALVGEAFNLLNLNGGAKPTPETPVPASPTIRVGVFAGF